MDTIKFSVVENFYLANKICTETALINGIAGEKMRQRIEPVRRLMMEGKTEEANQLKIKLPAIIPSGIFKGGRTADKLEQYSQVICLDLDKLSLEKVIPLKEKIANCEFTLAVFISPSGNGLKILIKVSSGSNYHHDSYRQLLKFYSQLTGEKFDEQTKDIARLMFLSYDPEPYYYPDSHVFAVVTPLIIPEAKVDINILSAGSAEESLHDPIYAEAYKYVERKMEYNKGNRNNFVFNLACTCNRYGLPREVLLSKIIWCDLTNAEKQKTVTRGYLNTDQHGTWVIQSTNTSSAQTNPTVAATVTNLAETVIEELPITTDDKVESRSVSPTLPSEVYDLLPDFLKGITSHFAPGIEKDIILLSSLGVISSAFPKTQGVYARSNKSLNLFELFVAPASAGKGQMKWAEALGKGIHNYLNHKFKVEYAIFIKTDPETQPKFPVERKFFVGSDSSNIALATQMHRNENFAVLYNSEAGSLAEMYKNTWSNSLSLYLKSFENESESVNRKSWKECFTIPRCVLSLVLSTTPNQLSKIIGSIESGFYSRFLIYYFNAEVVWKDFFSADGESLEPIFEKASQELLAMFKANEADPINTIYLSENQRGEIFKYFSVRLKEFHQEYDEQLVASVKRTCLIYYKIAMILTTLRSYQTMTVLPEKLTLHNDDHRAAFLIVDTLLEHVKIVYETSMQDETSGVTGRKKILVQSLPPGDFQKSTYIEISQTLGIKKPTAERYLKDLQKTGTVIRLEHGRYRKAA